MADRLRSDGVGRRRRGQDRRALGDHHPHAGDAERRRGLDDVEPEDFAEAVATAVAEASVPTEDYLMGMPHLAENLEAGLEALGIDVTGEEEYLL